MMSSKFQPDLSEGQVEVFSLFSCVCSFSIENVDYGQSMSIYMNSTTDYQVIDMKIVACRKSRVQLTFFINLLK